MSIKIKKDKNIETALIRMNPRRNQTVRGQAVMKYGGCAVNARTN
jgi:hypothetical protein